MTRANHRRGARRGSMVVTAFILILGMTATVAGIHLMLKEQIRQATQMRTISLAKMQCYYLAEMGINEVMFRANLSPDATPDPFNVTRTAGQGTRFDFKSNVAMVAAEPAGAAECTVVRRAPSVPGTLPFQVQARLVTPDGTFTRTVEFAVRKKPGTLQPWVLASYTLVD